MELVLEIIVGCNGQGYAPRSDPPDLADAVDAALLIPLLEAAAERWRASVAPDVQLYPARPKAALGRPCRPAAINEIRTA